MADTLNLATKTIECMTSGHSECTCLVQIIIKLFKSTTTANIDAAPTPLVQSPTN